MPSAESLPLSPEKTDSSRNLGGRAAWGRVCGRAKLLAGTLRCLHLLLGVFDKLVARPTVGALPQTPQGTLSLDPARGRRKGTKSPLDPFARLSWLLFPVPLACGFLVLRLNYYFPHSGRGYSPSSALRSIALATTALSSWYVTPYQRSGQVSTRAVAR